MGNFYLRQVSEMTQTAINYAKVLYELEMDRTVIKDTKETFEKVPKLKKSLISPVIPILVKHRIIEKIFPKEMRNFLKVLCNYQSVEEIENIFSAYEKYYNEQNGILSATLTYVDCPNEIQLEQMKKFLCKKYHAKEVAWKLKKDESLLGGFILHVKDYEYDWSLRGRMNQLKLIWR